MEVRNGKYFFNLRKTKITYSTKISSKVIRTIILFTAIPRQRKEILPLLFLSLSLHKQFLINSNKFNISAHVLQGFV